MSSSSGLLLLVLPSFLSSSFTILMSAFRLSFIFESSSWSFVLILEVQTPEGGGGGGKLLLLGHTPLRAMRTIMSFKSDEEYLISQYSGLELLLSFDINVSDLNITFRATQRV